VKLLDADHPSMVFHSSVLRDFGIASWNYMRHIK